MPPCLSTRNSSAFRRWRHSASVSLNGKCCSARAMKRLELGRFDAGERREERAGTGQGVSCVVAGTPAAGGNAPLPKMKRSLLPSMHSSIRLAVSAKEQRMCKWWQAVNSAGRHALQPQPHVDLKHCAMMMMRETA